MSKDNFIRDLHAELAPLPNEDMGGVLQTACATLTESERRQAEQLAAAANLALARFILVAVRRTLREARKAGALAENVTTPA